LACQACGHGRGRSRHAERASAPVSAPSVRRRRRENVDLSSEGKRDGFLVSLFVLVCRFRCERLTPRGEPRQTALVGAENRSMNDAIARNTRASSNEVPQSDPSQRQQLPVNAWRVPGDGALCRPLLGARSPRCQWGREQPPGLDRVSTPTPGRRVAHAPDVPAGMLGDSRCDLRAECTRVVTFEGAADPSRNALYFSTIILARSRPSP